MSSRGGGIRAASFSISSTARWPWSPAPDLLHAVGFVEGQRSRSGILQAGVEVGALLRRRYGLEAGGEEAVAAPA